MNVKTKKNNTINDKEEKKLIVVKRAKEFDNGIVFDMIVNDVTIYNCRLVEGSKGTFVSFPSRKGKDNKYYAYAYAKLSKEDVDDIVDQIEKM